MTYQPPQPASDRERAGLAGPVRSVRTDVLRGARPWYHSTTFYSPDGRITGQISHNPQGTVTRSVYHYDGAGRLAEVRLELDGIAAGRTVYLYDALGRLSYELTLRADGSEGRQTRRFYEPDGTYMEEFTMDPEGGALLPPGEGAENTPALERARFIRSRRDAAGRPLEMRFYDATGGLLHRFVYHYNAAGRLTDMEQRTGDTPLIPVPPETEAARALLEEFAALFSPDTALSTVRYRYDQQGRRSEAATWVGAHCIDRRAFAYDDRGDCVCERRYGPDGRLQAERTCRREYDDWGNWTREEVLSGQSGGGEWEPSNVTHRTIEYDVIGQRYPK